MLRILKEVPYGTHKDVYKKITESLEKLNKQCINDKYYEEKYYLYVMVLSRLCAINSNYLLKYKNIENALIFYDEISKKFNSNKNVNIKPISIYVRSLIKLVTNGISGEFKARKLDLELKHSEINSQYLNIIQNIYLENLEADNNKSEDKVNLFSDNSSTRKKYTEVLKQLVQDRSAYFIVSLNTSSECFFLADIKRDGKNHTTILNDVISGCKDDIYFAEGYVLNAINL